MSIGVIAKALYQRRIRFGDEATMQADVAKHLTELGYPFQREYRLSSTERIDFFLTADNIGLECKVAGGPSLVVLQIGRYLACPEVQGLIIVTRRKSHCYFPPEINGKPVSWVWVARQL